MEVPGKTKRLDHPGTASDVPSDAYRSLSKPNNQSDESRPVWNYEAPLSVLMQTFALRVSTYNLFLGSELKPVFVKTSDEREIAGDHVSDI